MKHNKIVFLVVIYLFGNSLLYGSIMNEFDSIGDSIKSIADKIAATFKGIGNSFGGVPHGYDYSYTFVNDTNATIYVNTLDVAMFMGGYFGSSGFQQTSISPYSYSYTLNSKTYYFEVVFELSSETLSNRLPYSHPDALYVIDCIQLPNHKSDSQRMNYYHAYMGKTFDKGVLVHAPQVEYVGYSNSTNPQDTGASVQVGSELTGAPALVVYNSTNTNYYIGYSSSQSATSLTLSQCDIFTASVPVNAFVQHYGFVQSETAPASGTTGTTGTTDTTGTAASTQPKQSLEIGTLGVFTSQDATAKSVATYGLPLQVFSGLTYTLEIYEDAGSSSPSLGIQAFNDVHDIPVYNVQDITPLNITFWYKSVAQLDKTDQSGMMNLEGSVWVVYEYNGAWQTISVAAGSAIQFPFVRPGLGDTKWIYFIYVNQGSATNAQVTTFVQNIAQGTVGNGILSQYQQQGASQYQQAFASLNTPLKIQSSGTSQTTTTTPTVPQNILNQSINAALPITSMMVTDTQSDAQAFLLGGDVFLPLGMGYQSVVYYELDPSLQSSNGIVTSTVTNGIVTGLTTLPKNMPTPQIIS